MPRDQYSPQADAEPGYCPGFWYHIAAGQVQAGAASSANVIRMWPFQIRALVDIVAIGGRITTLAVGGFCYLAIYRAHGNTLLPMGRPIGSTGAIATDTAVNVNGVLAEGRVQLRPGLYWFAYHADNATMAFQTIVNSQGGFIAGGLTQDAISSTATSVLCYRQIVNSGAVGTWPDLTDPVLTGTNIGNAHCLGQFQVAPAS